MKRIFISRDLTAESPFLQRLAAAGCKIVGQSLLEFKRVPFEEIPDADWIFFYSRHAVLFFLEGLKRIGQSLPGNVRFATIGKGTAATLSAAGLNADFSGGGDPEASAAAFLEVARGQRVLFPRARHSRRSVQKALGQAIAAIDLVVYDNRPAKAVPPNDFDVLVFTSPANARNFFKTQPPKAGQPVIAIGTSTMEALAAMGVENPLVATYPSEEALADIVLHCIT